MSDFHEIVCISEDEMRYLQKEPMTIGFPTYYSVTPNGLLRVWPKLPDSISIKIALYYRAEGPL